MTGFYHKVAGEVMASLNRVFILGNLGQDPELRYTAGQTAVATLNVATTENWLGRDGQRQENTEWHRVVVWGKQAENCSKYLAKGRSVFVEGRLQTRSWEDKNGQKRYTTEINASTVQFIGGAGGGASPNTQHFGASGGDSMSQERFSDGGGFGGGFPSADKSGSKGGDMMGQAPDLDDIPF
jgi:single-strand DNA-binding protein